MSEPTPRQKEIILHLSNGHTVEQIGERLAISHWTVRTHITDAFERCGANNSPGLIAMALRKGWIQ